MSDDEATPAPPDSRGAVARLTEALAAAQATARDGLAGLVDEDVAVIHERTGGVGSGTDPATPGGDDRSADLDGGGDGNPAQALHDRIAALPSVDGDEPVEPDAHVEPDPVPRPATARPRRLWPLYAIMAVLILAVPTLGYVGWHITSKSTAGDVVSGRSKPDAPGYTALVAPTPVLLVIHVADDGTPRDLTILALSGAGEHGGVILAAPVDVRLTQPNAGSGSMSDMIRKAGPDLASKIIGSELGLGFTDVVRVTDSELSSSVDPVAPLHVDNPEAVTLPDGTSLRSGDVALTAAQVPGYLAAQDQGHTTSGMLDRRQRLWKAWVAAIAAAKSPAAVPGERNVGLGHYLRSLAAGSVQSAAFPLVQLPEAAGAPILGIDHAASMLLVANSVPLPVGAMAGQRPTVALLNGTGPDPAPSTVIQRLNLAGAQINVVGNAKSFDVARTTLTYNDPKFRSVVEAMAKQLGVGTIKFVGATDSGLDVSIVMGRDLIDRPPPALPAVDAGGGT
ncbi:MAG: LytR C-terminal domain-containing protein [Actinobacteria bacterium]|nr:LytR C-terminal domain-containing protein [Actinomycetota bacterium]